METKLSYKCFEPHIRRLRYGGYYQIDPKSSKLQKRLHTIYMLFIYIWIIVYTIQQAMKVYEVRHDVDKIIGTMFLFLTHTDAIYKQTVIWIKADQVEELLEILRGPLFNQEEMDNKKYLEDVASHSYLLLHVDNDLALFTCFLWVLYPFVLHLEGKPVEFAIWLPYDVNVDPTFYFTIFYVWFTTSWLALCNTSIDVMVSFFYAQCKTQLTILRNDLVNLIQRSKEDYLLTDENYTEIISKRFKKILQHHIQIVYFVNKVESTFSTAVAYQFLISGWIICVSAYRMVELNPVSVQFLSMVSYICCLLIQIFMYCYYGSEVTVESEKLADSAYAMNWLETSLTHRRNLILFMERLKQPLYPLAGFVIPLSNYTFVSILKSSYTFYALLKNTSK